MVVEIHVHFFRGCCKEIVDKKKIVETNILEKEMH